MLHVFFFGFYVKISLLYAVPNNEHSTFALWVLQRDNRQWQESDIEEPTYIRSFQQKFVCVHLVFVLFFHSLLRRSTLNCISSSNCTRKHYCVWHDISLFTFFFSAAFLFSCCCCCSFCFDYFMISSQYVCEASIHLCCRENFKPNNFFSPRSRISNCNLLITVKSYTSNLNVTMCASVLDSFIHLNYP